MPVDALEQQQFAAGASYRVRNQAAQCRACRGHKGKEPDAGRSHIYVAGHHGIKWDAVSCGIEKSDAEDAPRSERPEDRPDECGVLGEQLLDEVQEIILAANGFSGLRWR